MDRYKVSGMSCAACSSHVEKAVSKVQGVTKVEVNLLTNSMSVEGTASSDAIIQAVKAAGYGASLQNKQSRMDACKAETFENTEIPGMIKRLISSVILLLPLMYVSMGHMMWDWPLPVAMAENHVAMGLYQMLITIMIMVINQKFFISGFSGLIRRSPNMDTLVAMGAAASFAYSTYALFAMTNAQMQGDLAGVMSYMHEFYFESAAMILTLITVGKTLEAYSKGKTTDALKSLMKLAPKTATVIRDEKEIILPVEQVLIHDIFVVKPGDSIPVDGVVIHGESAVDESSLSGESLPVDKETGDSVYAATINQSGFLKCRALKVGEDTTLAKIIQMVSDASATKAPIAKVADRVSGIFVPTVLLIAAVTFLVWLMSGQMFGFALSRAIAVLVISCPCALGLATPVAIMVGSGVGARNGILFKTAVSLEETGKVDIVALDKTGTITRGKPQVTDLVPARNCTEQELLELAYSLEQKSEHPLAKAIVDYAILHGITADPVEGFQAVVGNGLSGMIDGKEAFGGNDQFISGKAVIPCEVKEQALAFSDQGKTPLYFAKDSQFYGMVVVADVIKEESPQAIKQLHDMGIHVVMLTGDNSRTANAIGSQIGVDHVIADVMPQEKENVIRRLKEIGKVAMVGDGINDAPALTRAHMGIAIGAGTDVALEAADVVLMKSHLGDVPAAIGLSRRTLKNIHENLFWAFFYNVIGIPLAAGIWYPLFGWKLNPMFGAAAMSLSSFCVVMNALRLNFVKVGNPQRNHKRSRSLQTEIEQCIYEIKKEKENKQMEKTIVIKGMMCGHCEKHVKKALEALEGVVSAEASHEKGTAVVVLNAEVSNEVLKQTVEAEDYEVVEIR